MPTDDQILLAYKVFELERAHSAAQRKLREDHIQNQRAVATAADRYAAKLAEVTGIAQESLQFNTGHGCFQNHLIMHCVYDIRGSWPCCVFCGSPRDGW